MIIYAAKFTVATVVGSFGCNISAKAVLMYYPWLVVHSIESLIKVVAIKEHQLLLE